MIITADISMYPLDANYKPPIIEFIRRLESFDGIEVVPNQMSTQVRGEFNAVTQAVDACMREAMMGENRVVFVVRYLNADLEISSPPALD